MKIEEVLAIARLHCIQPGKYLKAELITDEGNFDCFAYDIMSDQVDCLWREDFFDAALRQSAARPRTKRSPFHNLMNIKHF